MKLLFFFAVSLFFTALAFAQPDLSKPLGKTIADTGSEFYRFETFRMDSEDGERHYKITVGIPKTQKPESGFPVIYLLDGNSAIAAMNERMFSEIAKKELPVIVAIGYETPLRFDVVARAFDYTPPTLDGSESMAEKERGRKGGGADIFAEFIEKKIKPRVESFVSIDRKRQTIWGHSYGGLFVLNTLFKHSKMFQHYFVADPSLWRETETILNMEKTFIEKEKETELRLVIAVGNNNGKRDNERVLQRQNSAIPPNSASDMSHRLVDVLKSSAFQTFDGLGHGEVFTASIEPAIRFCVQTENFDSQQNGRKP
ncbi:MAG: prolyl oligopeptidase family serine peptidase [Planctomycetaceae bacterium]|jgi:predicted alpha/beta superfamily hydrolase|nr:prolyl oligopeptidase family serine peptidase [Planctomycetaceae bacterium]